jgi:1-acyl-sn-glycerol-3-phosphate acyltransferase
MDKIINSRCSCDIGLRWKKLPMVMLEPCEHILHQKCINNIKDSKCPFCDTTIKSISSFEKIKRNKNKNALSYQKYVDMISVTYFDDMSTVNYGLLLLPNAIDSIGIMSTIPFLPSLTDNSGQYLARDLLCLINAKIIVNGMQNYKKNNKNEPKVYIANHTTHIDIAVMKTLFDCGFLTSSYIKESLFGRLIFNTCPLLVIKRGSSINTVEQMKKFVENNGSICLFPEGTILHPETLGRFRSGAFYIGYPICPVVIRYDPPIFDFNIDVFMQKIMSTENITIYVDILPEEKPPFDDNRIEEIRKKMAKVGNLGLSRVSNRDDKDK